MTKLEHLYKRNNVQFPGLEEFSDLGKLEARLWTEPNKIITDRAVAIRGGRNPVSCYGPGFELIVEKKLFDNRLIKIPGLLPEELNQSMPYWPFSFSDYMAVFPLESGCIALKPVEVIVIGDHLHNTVGPAVVFDDTEFWFLEGIMIEKEAVLDLKRAAQLWLKTRNVEIRRVLANHIGSTTKLFQLLGGSYRVLDRKVLEIPTPSDKNAKHIYELWEIMLNLEIQWDRNFKSPRRALHMENPSTNELHSEWVSPRCNTVEEALAERNQSEEHEIEVLPSMIS